MKIKKLLLALFFVISVSSFTPQKTTETKELICVMPICAGSSTSVDAVVLDRLIDFKFSKSLSKQYTQVSYMNVLAHCSNIDFCSNKFWNGYDIKKSLKLSGYVSISMADSSDFINYNIVIRGKKLWKILNLKYSKNNSKNRIATDICKQVCTIYNKACK